MKKSKLLILLAALLCLALTLASCSSIKGWFDKEETETQAEGTQEQQEPQKHELHDYFVLEAEEINSFTTVSQFEGEVVDYDEENHLLALRTKDLNAKNEVEDTVKVYNYMTGDVIAKYSVSNLVYASNDLINERLDVEIDYPIIRVVKTSYGEDSLARYDVSYYFANQNSELICQTNKTNYERFDFYNGLVAFDMGDDMMWINRNMEIVRTVDSVAANGYTEENFRCEYQGYLYAWGEMGLYIFTPDGICSGKYLMTHEGILNVHVLDDGNVLVQDLEEVDVYDAYDFKLDGTPYVVNSYVVNYVNGEAKAVELEYIVEDLATGYAQRYGNSDYYTHFPFELAEGRDNQAYIYRFANGNLATDPDYVVINNSLEIEYTVKNNTPGRIYYYAAVLNANLYMMPVIEAGGYQNYVFNLDGKAIVPTADDIEVTDKYIVTEHAIYDFEMNLVYAIDGSEFTNYYVDDGMNRIYLGKHNFNTGYDEWYVFSDETKTPVLWNDGSDERVSEMFDGLYVTAIFDEQEYSYEYGTGGTQTVVREEITHYKMYNNKDELLLTVSTNLDIDQICEGDAVVLAGEFRGNAIVFVVK